MLVLATIRYIDQLYIKLGMAAAISLVLVTYLTLLSHWGSGSPCRHDITSENWFYHWKKQSIHIRVRRKLRTLWDCAPSNSHYSRNHKVLSKKYLAIPRPKRFETNINVVSRLQMTVTHRTMLKKFGFILSKLNVESDEQDPKYPKVFIFLIFKIKPW